MLGKSRPNFFNFSSVFLMVSMTWLFLFLTTMVETLSALFIIISLLDVSFFEF